MRLLRHMILILPLLLAACGGYSFGEGSTSVLPPDYRTLAVSEVTNPTTLSWIEPRVRSLLRDELNNRGTITWSDTKSKADSTIEIIVDQYNRPTAVTGVNDQTLRSVAIFRFHAVIRSTTDDSVLWESGSINQTWPFFSGQEQEADMQVTQLGIRRLADLMTQNY